jgi:hypothetical protein
MAGFRADQAEFDRDDNVPANFELGLLVSHGLMIDIYEAGRGASKPWPAVAVDAGTLGGMSGGPVFDSRGFLVGVISSSFNMGDGQLPSPTFVALNWPILGARFPGIWPPIPPYDNQKTIIDLAGKACWVERPEAVTVKLNGEEFQTKYSPWT